jgi:hypothetical protein
MHPPMFTPYQNSTPRSHFQSRYYRLLFTPIGIILFM